MQAAERIANSPKRGARLPVMLNPFLTQEVKFLKSSSLLEDGDELSNCRQVAVLRRDRDSNPSEGNSLSRGFTSGQRPLGWNPFPLRGPCSRHLWDSLLNPHVHETAWRLEPEDGLRFLESEVEGAYLKYGPYPTRNYKPCYQLSAATGIPHSQPGVLAT